MLKSLELGVDQLYDGAGKAVALQVKVTMSPTLACCDIGSVVINGLTIIWKISVKCSESADNKNSNYITKYKHT